jgi:hypothetical protein
MSIWFDVNTAQCAFAARFLTRTTPMVVEWNPALRVMREGVVIKYLSIVTRFVESDEVMRNDDSSTSFLTRLIPMTTCQAVARARPMVMARLLELIACAACKYVCVHCSLLFVRVGNTEAQNLLFLGNNWHIEAARLALLFHASLKSATGLEFLGRSAAAQEKRESLAIESNANSNRGFEAAPTIRRPELPLGCLRVLPFCCIRARLASALGS